MTRLEKLKSLCAAATGGDMLTKGAYHFEMTGNFPALLALVEQMASTLEMLSKVELGAWYHKTDLETGYYAGFDDGEYAIKQALTAFAAWNENKEDVK